MFTDLRYPRQPLPERLSLPLLRFCSVLIPKGEKLATNVNFMGWCRKSDYWNTCEIKRKGQNSDGLIEREDGGKKKYNELEPMESFFSKIETHLYQQAFGE